MKTSLTAALLALSAGLLSAAPAAAAEPPSATAFFKRAAVRAPKLSPSGRYLAIQAAGKGDGRCLVVRDLQNVDPPKCVAGFNDADLSSHHWINEERLVFEVSDTPDGTTRVMGQGPVSYTHLDVYKRQGEESVSL